MTTEKLLGIKLKKYQRLLVMMHGIPSYKKRMKLSESILNTMERNKELEELAYQYPITLEEIYSVYSWVCRNTKLTNNDEILKKVKEEIELELRLIK